MSRPVWITLATAAVTGLAAARLSLPSVDQSPLPWTAHHSSAHHQSVPATGTPASPSSSVPPLRVRLGESATWQIRIDGPYQITRPGDWQILAQGPRLQESTAAVGENRLRIASREFETESVELRVVRPGSLWVGETRYRGDLRLTIAGDQRLLAINLVRLEDYLASVVNGEMPASFPDAARRAQAVAARTYAVYHQKTTGPGQTYDARAYDVRADQGSQVYRGMEYADSSGRRLAAETADSRRIVADTRGIVATYQGRLFCTFYSAVCGGHTVRGETVFPAAAPPLVGGPCDYCGEGPKHRWRQNFQWAEVEPALLSYLASSGRPVTSVTGLQTIDRDDGAPPEIEVLGHPAPVRIKATQFRRHVLSSARLPSDRFSVERDGDVLRVVGRGWGHGVGLCQWGARGAALKGHTCPEILTYYYPGCQFARLR